MARTLTSRLARTARLRARRGRRKRSPAIRLLLQSGDSAGGAEGRANLGTGARANSCAAAIGARTTRLARAKGNTRTVMRIPQPLRPAHLYCLSQERANVKKV